MYKVSTNWCYRYGQFFFNSIEETDLHIKRDINHIPYLWTVTDSFNTAGYFLADKYLE